MLVKILKTFLLAASVAMIAQAATQTIAFDAIPNQILGVSPFVIAAQASSLLPVSFASATPTVCKNSGPLVMVLNIGTCSITASQAGFGTFAPANPVTRTFEVKVGLTDPPSAMRLGATVTGTVKTEAAPIIEIPASTLTRSNQQPAVWIVDTSNNVVSMRNVDVLRFGQATVGVAGGLDTGEVVVTAGVQALHPGQKVRLLGSEP